MFKDSEGREYRPKVTCRTLAKFEEKTGIKLLDELFRLADKVQAKPGDPTKLGLPQAEILSWIASVFGGKFTNVLQAAWCAVETSAPKGMTFDDFADALDGSAAASLGEEVLGAYMGFFQKALANEKAAANLASLPLGLGKTSTK